MKNKRTYNNLKKLEKLGTLSDFGRDLLRDWGNPEIYGPWIEQENKTDNWDPSVGFKFYKSYYFINSSNKPAKIDSLFSHKNKKI